MKLPPSLTDLPEPVKQYIETHGGNRIPVFSPGHFESFATSKTSDCWGNNGGISIPGFLIAVCQPSHQSKGDPAYLFFDFIPH